METRIVSYIEASSTGPLQNPEDLDLGLNQDEDFVEQEMPAVFATSKRKSLPRPVRDSLATRERLRIGKPGSRRHNRFMNSIFLGADGTDSELDMDDMEDLFWSPEYRSNFTELFESEEKMAAWLPFLDIDDSDEAVLLSIVCGDSEEEVIPNSLEDDLAMHAEDNFLDIDRDTRKLLKQAFNFGLIQSIEAELLTTFMNRDASFMRNESYQYFDVVPAPSTPKTGKKGKRNRSQSLDHISIGLSFKNAKDRKVCHGVCKYYSLYSSSEASDGSRVTTISSPQDYQYMNNPPPLLSEYLWDNFFRA